MNVKRLFFVCVLCVFSSNLFFSSEIFFLFFYEFYLLVSEFF